MKAAKLLGVVEHQASRQLARLLDAAKSGYDSIMQSASNVADVTEQRRYIRAVERTVTRAEKIISQLKKRIAAVKRQSGGARKRRPVKRKAKRAVKRTARKRSSRKKRV